MGKTVKKLNANSAQILNAIRNQLSVDYKNAIPIAKYGDTENLKEIGQIFLSNPSYFNEAVQAIWNLIGKVEVSSRTYDNPLRMFKKDLPFGATVEDIFVEAAEGRDYGTDEPDANPFKRVEPTVKAAFYTINYEKQYQATLDQRMYLRRAFQSWDGVDDLIARMTDSLVVGANLDEFLVMKYLLAVKTLNGQMYVENIGSTETKEGIEDLLVKMRATSGNLTFMNKKYNLAGVLTNTPVDDQFVLINTEAGASIDVKALAAAFNLQYEQFLGHEIRINGFDDIDGSKEDCRLNALMKNAQTGEYLDGYTPLTTEQVNALNAIPAFVVDRDFFKIYDQFYEMTEAFNARRNYWNYFLSVSKIVTASPFANAIAYVPGETGVTSISIAPVSASVSAGQSVAFTTTVETTGFASKAVKYTLSGDGADKATIDPYGILTTKSDATGTITVTATSVADPTKTAEATVTVQV